MARLVDRKFEPELMLASSSSSSSSLCTLTVLTWNTLAKSLCDEKSFPRVDTESSLQWPLRCLLMRHQLEDADADIVCLQEIDVNTWHSFFAVIAETCGYACVYEKKQGALSRHGCAILFKKAKFRMVSQETHRLDEHGSQIAIFARLYCMSSRVVFGIVCTHLKSKPEHWETRKVQATHIVKHVRRYFKSDDHIIIMGDFNEEPNQPATDIMTSKLLLRSAYSDVRANNNNKNNEELKQDYSTYKNRDGVYTVHRTIDYIWFDPRKFQVLQRLSIPDVSNFPQYLPCRSYPSDHLALAVRMQYVPALKEEHLSSSWTHLTQQLLKWVSQQDDTQLSMWLIDVEYPSKVVYTPRLCSHASDNNDNNNTLEEELPTAACRAAYIESLRHILRSVSSLVFSQHHSCDHPPLQEHEDDLFPSWMPLTTHSIRILSNLYLEFPTFTSKHMRASFKQVVCS